jgi:hypothetical protein
MIVRHLEKATIIFLWIIFILSFQQQALAQNNNPKVLKLAGRAEILEMGRRTPAKEGQFLAPGQTIELVGGGEVQLLADRGQTKLTLKGNTTLEYTGPIVKVRPWSGNYEAASGGKSGEDAVQYKLPKGEVEIDAKPLSKLQIVTPLVLAAVRGTHFIVTVGPDGSTTVRTLEGTVEFLSRQGEVHMIGAGQSRDLTAAAYTRFLASRGITVPPGGDWRSVPANRQEQVDREVVGPLFGERGATGSLAAILANPNVSPTAGQAVLAQETGTVFNKAQLTPAGSGPEAVALETEISAFTFSDYLFLADLDSNMLNDAMYNPLLGYLVKTYAFAVGEFNLPTSINTHYNNYGFTLNLETGVIDIAAFEAYYETSPNVVERVVASFGHGQLTGTSFNISDFYGYFENTAGAGMIGPGTTFNGNLAGSPAIGTSVSSATVTPQYQLMTGTNTMPSSFTSYSGRLRSIPEFLANPPKVLGFN